MTAVQSVQKPATFGTIGQATTFSGILKEADLRQAVADCLSDSIETVQDATAFLCRAFGNNAMLSDILLVEGSVDALKCARDKAAIEWKSSSTAKRQIAVLIEVLEAKSMDVPSLRLGSGY